MGHSFGGLITQLLLDRLLGAAGVGLSPAPPKGIYLLPPRALKSAFPVLKSPANRKKTVPLTPEQFHASFANTLSAEDSKDVYDQFHIPAPGRPLFQAAFANMDRKSPLGFDKKRAGRAPLLIVGATKDHLVPSSLATKIFHLYKHSPSTTELKVFDGRSHFLCGEPGWEEIADYSLTWAANAASASHLRRDHPVIFPGDHRSRRRERSGAAGMAGTVPGRVTATAAARLARSSAGSSSVPAASEAARTPRKQSPAPVVSTAWTRMPGIDVVPGRAAGHEALVPEGDDDDLIAGADGPGVGEGGLGVLRRRACPARPGGAASCSLTTTTSADGTSDTPSPIGDGLRIDRAPAS